MRADAGLRGDERDLPSRDHGQCLHDPVFRRLARLVAEGLAAIVDNADVGLLQSHVDPNPKCTLLHSNSSSCVRDG